MAKRIFIKGNQKTGFPFYIYKTGNIGAVQEHDHDFFEIVYIYHGNGVCRIGGHQYSFKSNQLIFTPEYVSHNFESGKGGLHRQVSIAVHRDIFDGISLKNFKPADVLERIKNKRNFIVSVPTENIQEIEETIDTLYQSLLFKTQDWTTLIQLELLHMLLLIGRFTGRNKGNVSTIRCEDPRVFMTLKKMETEYYSPTCLKDAFNTLKMNNRYFIRLFKKYTGFPPLNYLNRLRIEKACELLKKTSHPVIQVAYDVGYTDLTHFNRLFKKYLRIPPTQYRFNLKGQGGNEAFSNHNRFTF